MKKYINRLIPLFICVFLPLTLIGGGVSGRSPEEIDRQIKEAETKAEQLAQSNKKLEEEINRYKGDVNDLSYLKSLVEQEIGGVKDRMNTLSALIDLKKEAVDAKQTDIETLIKKISDAEADIKIRNAKIEILQAENEQNKGEFGQIVKNEYMSGKYGYIDVLMKSGDFFDLVVRSEVMKKAGERHMQFMEDLLNSVKEQEEEILNLERLQIQLDKDKITCENEKVELEVQLQELNARMADLDAEMLTEQSKLYGYAKDITDLQGSINSMYHQWNATNEQIEELENLTNQLIKEKQDLNRADYSGDGFRWPLESKFKMITCVFGYDSWRGGMHYGIDIGNSGINGSNVYAAQSGTVIYVATGYGGGYGNHIIIDHGGGVSTLYAHMQNGSLRFSAGSEVSKGDVLGLVGSTGYSTGPHLHFGVYVDGTAVNPQNYSYSDY